jgi:GT2 family glycosyltransferase
MATTEPAEEPGEDPGEAPGESLDVSIVIACLNGAATLGAALASLVAQAWDRPFEILLADNGSTDASVAIFEAEARAHPGLRMRVVDARAERGKSFALNTAIRAAAGRAILFCDADDTVAPGWLAAMGRALGRHPFVAARIDLRALSPAWTVSSRVIAQESRLNRLPHPPHALVAGGATLGFTREVFAAAGGFDPAFAVMEDIDFCVRAHLAGFELVFVPEAVYHYRFRGDPEAIRRQSYAYAYYRALLRRRYGGEPLLTFRPWADLFGRAATLARRRAKAALGRPGLRKQAVLAQASGQLWGQIRGALAFRVAPPRQRRGGARAAPGLPGDLLGDGGADTPGDMALTPPA